MILWARRLVRRLWSDAVQHACAGHGLEIAANVTLSSGAAVLESASLILLTALAVRATGSDIDQLASLPALSPRLTLSTLLIVMAAVLLSRLLLQLLAAIVAARTISSVVSARRHRAVATYLDADWLSQAETESGHLQDLVNNFAPRVGQLVGNLIQLLNRGVSALIMLSVAIVVSPIAAAGVLALTALVFALLTPLRSRIRRLARRGSGTSIELGRQVSELPGLVREIRTYSVAERLKSFLGQPVETLRATQARTEVSLGLGVPLFQAIALAGFTTVLSLAAVLFQNDIASLGAVVLVAFRSLSYGQAMQVNVNRVIDLAGWVDRFDASVARFAASPVRFGRRALPERPVLRFDEVSFHYRLRESPALVEVSCEIAPGQAVGLVGPTGSGKSTFVAVMLRLVQPTGGRYEVSGVPALEYDPESWGSGFAFVPQVPHIIGGTIRDNVSFFRPVSDAALERALRAANLWQEVQAMPRRLATEIGLAGSDLSGGQRQRLALARALVGEPSILILDEPTSALDALSERAIVESLAALRGRVTAITVAHRLSTLAGCDSILVLESGRLVDSGPPDELASRPGFFARSLESGRFPAAETADE